MKVLKIYISLLIFFIINGFTIQENNVDGLIIQFRKVSEDYVKPGIPMGKRGSSLIEASEGMKFVKLKLTLKNIGKKDCLFNFSDVYLSTQQDSLYPFLEFQTYFVNFKTKIKPNHEIKRVILFEFPINAKPKELFIEDKRYKVIEDKE